MDAYVHVIDNMAVRGNLVADAHIAAMLFQHGVRTLYANDRDGHIRGMYNGAQPLEPGHESRGVPSAASVRNGS